MRKAAAQRAGRSAVEGVGASVRWVGGAYPNGAEADAADAIAEGWAADEADAYCARCGATTGPGAATPSGCPHCHGTPVPWHRVTRLSGYDEPVTGWIKQLKYHRQWHWGRWFARELASGIEAGGLAERGRTLTCPVPMHWTRRLARGYDQAELLAEALAARLGVRCAPVLQRTRRTPKQTMINQRHRHDNVRGAFGVRAVDLAGWDVLLVDDVKTSGATAGACTRLLKKAGARTVRVVVVAVADPKGQGFKTT